MKWSSGCSVSRKSPTVVQKYRVDLQRFWLCLGTISGPHSRLYHLKAAQAKPPCGRNKPKAGEFLSRLNFFA
jgi:hypothetical protein